MAASHDTRPVKETVGVAALDTPLSLHELKYRVAKDVTDALRQHIADSQKALVVHETNLARIKFQARHPYKVALRAWFECEPVVDLCVAYLPDLFCEQCQVLRLSTTCLNCTNTFNTPSTYQVQGDMVRVHDHLYGPCHLYCYQPRHMDDVQLVSQWNAKIAKDYSGKPRSWSGMPPLCPETSPSRPFLSTIHSAISHVYHDALERKDRNVNDIPKGKHIAIAFNSSYATIS